MLPSKFFVASTIACLTFVPSSIQQPIKNNTSTAIVANAISSSNQFLSPSLNEGRDDAFEIMQKRSPVGKTVRNDEVHHLQLVNKRAKYLETGNQEKFEKWDKRVKAFDDMSAEPSEEILGEYEKKDKLADRSPHLNAWLRLMHTKAKSSDAK